MKYQCCCELEPNAWSHAPPFVFPMRSSSGVRAIGVKLWTRLTCCKTPSPTSCPKLAHVLEGASSSAIAKRLRWKAEQVTVEVPSGSATTDSTTTPSTTHSLLVSDHTTHVGATPSAVRSAAYSENQCGFKVRRKNIQSIFAVEEAPGGRSPEEQRQWIIGRIKASCASSI